MTEPAGNVSPVRQAASDVRGDRWRIVRAAVVLLLVPVSTMAIIIGLFLVSIVIARIDTAAGYGPAVLTVSGYFMPLAFVLALSAFALFDALYIPTLTDEGGFQFGYTSIRGNLSGVAVSIPAFVVAFWPYRFVVWPLWTLLGLTEAFPVLEGDVGWFPTLAFARATVIVLVLSVATLYLTPLTVLGGRGPTSALRENVRLVRAAPVETAMAALVGLGAVIAGFFAFGLGLLALAFSLGFWIFSIFLLPFAIPIVAIGFVCLAASYAYARTLAVETYRNEKHRLSDGSAARPASTPVD